ncbi:MAG: hypothetical protein JWO12_3369 [Frankiales bacterium]|nr:hypothetical protein [Frankiales bacterium]
MPRATRAKNAPVTAPLRSPNAARAHAAGEVTWTIDLAQSPGSINERAVSAANRSVMALGLVAVSIWGYDLAGILRH